jgi:F-type H+-transporting ATPase subunit delta
MKASTVNAHARALVEVAASRGRAAEAARALALAAELFRTPEGREAAGALQSARLPSDVREEVLEEIARGLELPEEVKALVSAFASGRALRRLMTAAALAAARADAVSETARVEVASARPLDEAAFSRLRSSMKAVLGREVALEARENPALLAGAVVRAGNRVWDGSLAGRLERAREGLGVRAAAG